MMGKPRPLADRLLATAQTARDTANRRLDRAQKIADRAVKKPLERVAVLKQELARIDRLIEFLEDQLDGEVRDRPRVVPLPKPVLQPTTATPLVGGRCVHCLAEPRLGKSLYGYKCIGLIKKGMLRKVEWNRCHCGNAKKAVAEQCDRCLQLATARA